MPLIKRQSITTPAAWALACTLLLAGPLTANAQDDAPLQSRMEAYVVEIDDDGEELVRPAREVEPGQLIEWQIVFNNVSSEPQNSLVVTGPVPPNTEYEGGTAVTRVDSVFLVSIDDGKTFEVEPVRRRRADADGRLREVIVPPSEYTHVRWNTNQPIRGFESQEYRYRVRVE